jgi:adenylate cyclase
MIPLRPIAEHLQKNRQALILAIALLGTLGALGLSILSLFDTLERKTLDLRFRTAAHAEWADTSIVMVAVDQNSLDFVERQWQMKWPWPREYYGLLLRFLKHGQARMVAFDYDLSQRDVNRLEVDGKESDQAFASAMAESGNILLGVNLGIQDQGDLAGDSVHARHLIGTGRAGIPGIAYDRAAPPIPEFQTAAAALGVTNFGVDDDGIARRVIPVYPYKTDALYQFSTACFALDRKRLHEPPSAMLENVPRTSDGSILVYWYGRGGPSGVFRYYSAHSLLVSSVKMDQGMLPDIQPEIFRNKIVIVGGSAAGLYDFKPTPFTYLELYPGMEIQATVLSNLLNGHHLHETSTWLWVLITFAIALITAWIFFRVRHVGLASLLVILTGVTFLGAALIAFRTASIWLPVIPPMLALGLTFALSAVVSYASEGQQKRVLRRAFNRYFSPHVVTDILNNAGEVELGGKTIEATVFFSDIKDFTSISEQFTPKDLVHFLNQYFSLASDIILENEAMLDKYIGDAIMAIFGAPIPRPDNARVACLTALQIQEALAAHHGRPDRDPRMPTFVTRIGLHTGKMVVGNIGSSSRLDYTAIGDTVNLASRLEGVNKVFGTKIIISETTFQGAQDWIVARPLDYLRVKGKAIPVRIFELVGRRDAVNDATLKKITRFEEGLALYHRKQFSQARSVFEEILAADPADAPSTTYVQRCEELAQVSLPDDWDGVYTLTSK